VVPGRAPIAIACCRSRDDGDASDLYPDPDSELLREALAGLGSAAEMVSWDDPGAGWSRRAAIVIRSTWDSVDRPAEFIHWARDVAECSMLINPPGVIEWNLDKSYLVDLDRERVPVVPTQWLRAGSAWEPPPGEYVIKPAISAGGRETARYGPGHEAGARRHVAKLVGEGRTVMLQPYLPSVSDPGEISLIFIGDRFSHAVRKGPVLEAGKPVQPRPWERMNFLGLCDPTPTEKDLAATALAAVRRRFGHGLVYARIDLLQAADSSPLVLEVELIDPNLSLTLLPRAAERLARAISAAAEGRIIGVS
jgi:glutathione synthase/RimK-type ligase-like ATP-grasp enzyme